MWKERSLFCFLFRKYHVFALNVRALEMRGIYVSNYNTETFIGVTTGRAQNTDLASQGEKYRRRRSNQTDRYRRGVDEQNLFFFFLLSSYAITRVNSVKVTPIQRL